MELSEELEIINAAKRGDKVAFEKLLIDNQKKVYNIALRMVGNPEDALDMSQEAFLKAYMSISGFRGESRFSVWLYRLTTNVCLDFLRRESKRSHASLTYPEDEDREFEIPDHRFSPQSEVERSELHEALKRGLDQLPDDFRAILVLREIGGLSYCEIGETLSLEEGTVKSRIFRARKKLCLILETDRNFPYQNASKTESEV